MFILVQTTIGKPPSLIGYMLYKMKKRSCEFCFVDSSQRFTSVRAKQLEDSAIRSHAARISHRLRRGDSFHPREGPAPVPPTGVPQLFQDSVSTRDSAHSVVVEDPVVRKRDHSQRAALLERTYDGGAYRLNVVYKGNSDPFKTRAVLVNANINRIVTFIREVALPSLYFTPYLRHCAQGSQDAPAILAKSTVISSRAAARDWKQIVANLDSEGPALACLAAFLCLLSRFTGASTYVHDSSVSLLMRTKSSALLRDALCNHDQTVPLQKSLVIHMFWLFRAEAFAENLAAATVHGSTLWRLMKVGIATGAVDLGLMLHILFVDVDLAVKFMVRPLFDVDFCTGRIQPLWSRASGLIPPKQIVDATKVHETVDFEPLREM